MSDLHRLDPPGDHRLAFERAAGRGDAHPIAAGDVFFGGQPFPGIDEDGSLTLTLGSHDFFWLRVRSAASNPSSPQTQALPILPIRN